jgi:hypothetical protein
MEINLEEAKSPLEVNQIPGEKLCYWVESQSRPESHRVDLLAADGNGQCGCEDFAYRQGPRKDRLHIQGVNFRCIHIKAARRAVAAYTCNEIMADIDNFVDGMIRTDLIAQRKAEKEPARQTKRYFMERGGQTFKP